MKGGTLLTKKDMARYLKVSNQFIYRLIKRGILTQTPLGRVYAEELEDYLSELNGRDIRLPNL